MKLLAESLELKYSKWNNKISGVYKNHELEIYIVNIPNEAAIESDYLFIKMDGKEVHKEYLGLKKDIKEDDYQLKYEVLNKEKIKAVVDNLIT